MGNEMEKDNIIETSPGDDDLMLPEGYGADDDIFADPTTWTGKQTDEPAAPDRDEEDETDDGAEDAPTTAQDSAQDVSGSEKAEAPTTEPAAPTTAQETAEPAPNMLRFRAKIDHNEQDVELSQSELPNIWQKAQNHDRMQSRVNQLQAEIQGYEALALTMGYANAREMREKAADAYRDAEVRALVDKEGVPERIAKFVVNQEMRERSAHAPSAPAAAAAPQQTAPNGKDPAAEVAELLQARPDLRGKQLPPEVITSAAAGKNLLLAYTEYENRQKTVETEKAQRENDILKQNAENAKRAPVKSVAAGGNTGGKSVEDDDFLRGFNANI